MTKANISLTLLFTNDFHLTLFFTNKILYMNKIIIYVGVKWK